MVELAYVYILASSFQHLYIGVTTELEPRIWKHKNLYFGHLDAALNPPQIDFAAGIGCFIMAAFGLLVGTIVGMFGAWRVQSKEIARKRLS